MKFKNLFYFFLSTCSKKPQSSVHFNTPYRLSSSYNSKYSGYQTPIYPVPSYEMKGNALDVNCKFGDSTKKLSNKYPELNIYGIDKNPKFVEVAQKKYKNIDFLNLNFEDYTGIPYNSFQVIQISDYDELFLTYQKSMSILDNSGLLIYNCKNKNHTKLLENYLTFYQKSLFTNSYHPNKLSHFISDNTIFIFKG